MSWACVQITADRAPVVDAVVADPTGWVRLSAGDGTKGARLHWSYHQLGRRSRTTKGQWTRGLLLRRNDGDIAYCHGGRQFALWSPLKVGGGRLRTALRPQKMSWVSITMKLAHGTAGIAMYLWSCWPLLWSQPSATKPITSPKKSSPDCPRLSRKAADPLVGTGDQALVGSAKRYQACALHSMVAMATSTSGGRTTRSLQDQTTTVMLGRLRVENSLFPS